MKRQILISLILLRLTLAMNAQTLIGIDPSTQIRVYEFYHHCGTQEWLKVCRIYNDGWNRGGVSGLLFFNNYYGEGSGFVEYTFPQSITSDQKPIIVLHGNAANDFSWYAYQNVDENGKNVYDIFIKTPTYHVGFTFLMRGYGYNGYCTVESSPVGTISWNSNDNQESIVFYNGNGKIGLGTLTPNYKLDVNGTIHSREVTVDLNNFPDFVFNSNYKLMAVGELEQFIKIYGHLPNIPNAAEVEKNGINLGDMQAKLLQKIEELTLYTIEQNNKIIELEKQNKKIKALEEEIEKLKEMTK